MAFEDEGPSFEQPPRSGPQYEVTWTGLVSRTFTLYGRKLVGYIMIASVPIIINIAIQVLALWFFFGPLALLLIGSFGTDPFSILLSLFTTTADFEYLMVSIPLMFLGIIVSAIVSGACIKLALDNYGAPDMGDWRESFSFATGRIVTIIAVNLLTSLILIICMMPGLVLTSIALATMDFTLIAYSLIVMYVGLPVALYLMVRFAPAIAVVIAEDHSAIGSMKRAYALSSGEFWHIFAGQILLGLVVAIVGIVIGFAAVPITLFGFGDVFLTLIAFAGISMITTIITSPLSYIFYAVLYRDLAERQRAVVDLW